MTFSNPLTIQSISILYVDSNKRSVEIVRFLDSNTEMIAKIYKITDKETYTKAKQEISLTKKLRNYKRAVKFISSEEYSINNVNFIAIYLKYYENGNMQGLFRRLESTNIKLDTRIILKMIYDFALMLENLEKKSICHRDIKFENIFLGKNDKFYLGDFGDGKQICLSAINKHTLRGTKSFCSPKIANAYEDYLSQSKIDLVDHNPYKSDVFSLGLVALYIYNVNDVKYSKNQYLNKIKQELNKVNHPYLSQILNKMLDFDEASRPNFIELHSYLKKFSNLSICAVCESEINEIESHCVKCLFGFHKRCLSKKTSCTMCKTSLYCKSCGENLAFYVKHSDNSLCLQCHIQKNTNSLLKLLDFPVPLKDFDESELKCQRCDIEFQRNLQINHCTQCSYSQCMICSRNHSHYTNCIENFKYKMLNCRCGNKFIEYTEDLFDRCEHCGIICKICLKTDIEISHLACVTTFELYKPSKYF